MTPSVGAKVHYVSHGTPPRPDGTQAYASVCRAAIITEVTGALSEPGGAENVGLCVVNPTGLFFDRLVPYHAGGETAGQPGCPDAASHGSPFRYCACGWAEAAFAGGTWHWPDHS